jgi:hypothetical protein
MPQQLTFNKTTTFTAPSQIRAPHIAYPKLTRNAMPLKIPVTMSAKSAWTNTFIVHSNSTTGLSLTIKTSNATITCSDTEVLAAIADPALASTNIEEIQAEHDKMIAAAVAEIKQAMAPENGL